MKTTTLLLISLLLFGCSKKNTEKENADNTLTDTSNLAGTGNVTDSIQPIWGYRFQIIGDFDGNGIKDTLNEHFYSRRDKKKQINIIPELMISSYCMIPFLPVNVIPIFYVTIQNLILFR